MINQENIQGFIKWTNIVGIFSIVLGALAALAGIFAFVVGAIPGVLMIIAGVKLLNAKKAAAELAGIEDPVIFNERLNNLISESTGFFKFQGIYYIVSIVMGIIGVVIYIAIIAALISNMSLY